MKIGMPSLVEFSSIEENLELCKELGLDFVEINMNMSYCLPEFNDLHKIKRLLDEYNLSLTMHFPEEIDFGTPFKIISDANLNLFEEFCLYGSQIKVEKINVHLLPGAKVTLPSKTAYAYESNLEHFYQNVTTSFQNLVAIGNKYQIQVCVENVDVPEFLLTAFTCLSEIKDLGFTYDIGHDAKGNYNVEKLYQILGNKVNHMHLHDYDGKTDHQVLFQGKIDLVERLKFAKKNDMSVVIEVKTKEALTQSVHELRKRNLI